MRGGPVPNCMIPESYSGSNIGYIVDEINKELLGEVYNDSRRKNYHLRKDVIYKTIFRAVRKHQITRFRDFFDYTKIRWTRISYGSSLLIKKIDEYVENEFCDSDTEVKKYDIIKYFLRSFLDPKNKHISMHYKDEHIHKLVYDLIYKFSKK